MGMTTDTSGEREPALYTADEPQLITSAQPLTREPASTQRADAGPG